MKDGTQSISRIIPSRCIFLTSRSITFEHVPSDYAILKIHTLPEDVGGDTLWASGYEVYDRLSPTWQKIADGLTATHQNPEFLRVVAEHGVDLITEDRGSPDNKGLEFSAQQ